MKKCEMFSCIIFCYDSKSKDRYQLKEMLIIVAEKPYFSPFLFAQI